jgi:hypothetical protein
MYWQSRVIREPRVDTWGSSLLHFSKEEPMAMLQDAKRSTMAAAKADREREKTEAMREYQAGKVAAQANMARLRALRLAKESTASPPQAAAPRPAQRKATARPAKRKTAGR